MRLPSPIPYSKWWRNIFLLHTSKSISGLAWFTSDIFLFRTCATTAMPYTQQNRKTWRECACGEEKGIVYALEYTVCTITYITTDCHSCRKSGSPFVLSNTVVQKKNSKFLFAFFFSFNYLKKLHNILSNIQYCNIFYLVKLYFFLSSVQWVVSEVSLTEASLFPYPCSQLARYKSFQNSVSLHLHSPQNLFLWYHNYKN